MGGTVFVLSAAVATVAICAYKGQLSKTVWILLVALLGYGIIGFLDDGLKLFFKRNLGLRAWQKNGPAAARRCWYRFAGGQ